MAWKQSLAQIKQDLKTQEGPPKAAPPPKPVPKKVEETKPLEEEDALFLSVMGAKPKAKPAPKPEGAPPQVPEAPDEVPGLGPDIPWRSPSVMAELPNPEAEPSFNEAMASLKGIKPVGRSIIKEKEASPVREVVAPVKVTAPPEPEPPLPEALPVPPVPVPEPSVAPAAPVAPRRIQLAAGMAIEVDGSIDLRGHSIGDARERVKERVLDSICLGWRTLHVQLGDSEDRQQAFLDYIQGAEPRHIERFAQAPIPMGGAAAWILYLGKG